MHEASCFSSCATLTLPYRQIGARPLSQACSLQTIPRGHSGGSTHLLYVSHFPSSPKSLFTGPATQILSTGTLPSVIAYYGVSGLRNRHLVCTLFPMFSQVLCLLSPQERAQDCLSVSQSVSEACLTSSPLPHVALGEQRETLSPEGCRGARECRHSPGNKTWPPRLLQLLMGVRPKAGPMLCTPALPDGSGPTSTAPHRPRMGGKPPQHGLESRRGTHSSLQS